MPYLKTHETGKLFWAMSQAKETKCGEMDGKKSKRLAVPLSQGNHPEGTLGREGDAIL